MRAERRTYSNGEDYFSIVYYDGKKKVRLKQTEHPKFETFEEAQEWAKAKAASYDCLKARAMKRLEWKSKYYNFKELIDEYESWCKKAQKNSWKNTLFYLQNYVIHYFLDVVKENNPNNWPTYFEKFKNWLEEDAKTTRKPIRNISYSSKNHCIKSLNTFLSFLVRNGKADPANIYKITGFGRSTMNYRDADSLIPRKEFDHIYKRMLELDEQSAIFYQTCYFTGMRFNEVFGLSIDDLFPGEIEDNVLNKILDQHDIEYYGYIVLQDQPFDKARKRNDDGSIDRKPLKSKKAISEKNNRIIPITDKDLYNNLVKLYKKQKELQKKRVYGLKAKNYVLFDDLNVSMPKRFLESAYSLSGYKYKTFHCCRHTRATELVGLTQNFILAKYWLGHSRQETTERYTHIFQQSNRQAKNKEKLIDFI